MYRGGCIRLYSYNSPFLGSGLDLIIMMGEPFPSQRLQMWNDMV